MEDLKIFFYRWMAIHYCKRALRIEEERAYVQGKMQKYLKKAGYE